MIRAMKNSDVYMRLSPHCLLEMDAVLAEECTSAQFLYGLMKASDVAYCYYDKKPLALFGFTKTGGCWVMFSNSDILPPSFFKELRRLMKTALERYGVLYTQILEDVDEDFKKKLVRLMGGKVVRRYVVNGHAWADCEARYVV